MQRGACLQAARPMRRGTHKLAVACGDRVAVHVHGRQHREEFEAVLAVGGADVGGQLPRSAQLSLDEGPISGGDEARHAGGLQRHTGYELGTVLKLPRSW